jgi:hypothetical protein
LLEVERRSLIAHLCPLWRPRGRYEDLSLVMMLARFQRDWLSQEEPRLEGVGHERANVDRPGDRLADWALPWGVPPRVRLEAHIDRVESALNKLGRWLPRRTVAKAEGRARQRMTAITTQLKRRDLQADAAAATAARGQATVTLGLERPSHARAAAIAGLSLLAAGLSAFLLASHPGGPDSAGRQGAAAGAGGPPHAINVPIQGRQGARGPHQSEAHPGQPRTRVSARASTQGSTASAPVASDLAPQVPEQAPVVQPVAAPEPAPAPARPSPSSSSTSSVAKSAGGCPPEFGWEC